MQIAVVGVAIILTALVGYQIKSTTSYEETGTAVFTVKQFPAQVNASFGVVQSLTATGEIIVQGLISQDSRTIIRRAGGTAAFNAEITNYNNEDFPEYAYPFATLVVQGPALEEVHATFKIITSMLRSTLAKKQTQAGVKKTQRITISVIDVTGPLAEKPSHIRAYTALCLLSVIGASMSLIFIRRLLPSRYARSFVGVHRAAKGAEASLDRAW